MGLDDANTLAIDVFPVYVKVDLDEMNYIREFAQLWSHPRYACDLCNLWCYARDVWRISPSRVSIVLGVSDHAPRDVVQ